MSREENYKKVANNMLVCGNKECPINASCLRHKTIIYGWLENFKAENCIHYIKIDKVMHKQMKLIE